MSPNPRWSNIDSSGPDLTSIFYAIMNGDGLQPKNSNSGKQKAFTASN